VSNASSHAGVRSMSSMSPQFAICTAKRHSTSVGGIFMHFLFFSGKCLCYCFWKAWSGSC